MDADSKSKPLHENLDTTFVNLWSLLRSLTQKKFVGRVHVELPDYSADIFMNGSSTPLVHEIDRAAGTETVEEAALHRLVLRARETPGTITVFEGDEEAAALPAVARVSETSPVVDEPSVENAFSAPAALPEDDSRSTPGAPTPAESFHPLEQVEPAGELREEIYPTGSYQDWPAILAASGELIGAVERGVNATGEDFGSLFGAVRLELADDYSFLDPLSKAFEYADKVASLNDELSVSVYVSGLSEALRRTVDRVALGERARRVRERVALEILTVARKHRDVLDRSGFQQQLDRIAGTRVI